MAKTPLSEISMDESAYKHADRQFQLVQRTFPEDAVQSLAQEVVRRLAFRMPRHSQTAGMPTPEEVERLCFALLSTEEGAGDKIILAAQRDDATAEVIYLGYVAGAARRLGEMWTEDRVSFAEVTVATSRLYRIIRGLRHFIDSAALDGAVARHVLFALTPGDTHTLGIEIATDLFRRDGWDVATSLGESHDAIVAMTETERFQSIVLVAHSEESLPQLINLVIALRITQPLAHILLAGNIVETRSDIGDLAGVDDIILDIETAIKRLQAIVLTDS